MIADSMNVTGTTFQKMPQATEQIDTNRKKIAESPDDSKQGTQEKNAVPPEEFLKRVKALTENGTYSVRFETDPSTQQMIVKVVDSQTDEVIRQVPPESLLGTRQALTEYEGNFVNTKS
jgi:flagellar protein FlaG